MKTRKNLWDAIGGLWKENSSRQIGKDQNLMYHQTGSELTTVRSLGLKVSAVVGVHSRNLGVSKAPDF